MGPAPRWAWRMTVIGLSMAAVGLVVLVAQASSEVLRDPTLSLIDGYSIGRLPGTSVGVDLTVIGATLAVVFGSITTWRAGGWMRRGVVALSLAVAACWWFLALLPPPQGAYCAACQPPGPDPMTMAYSQPDVAVLLLLLPALVAGVLAFTGRRRRSSQVAVAGVT
jgi:hypothetical protein